MFRIAPILFVCLIGLSLANSGMFKCPDTNGSIHRFAVKTLDGRLPTLSAYRGSVVIVVNVASFCTYTSQYLDFAPLLEKFPGLKILAFPCNQFLMQEPIRDDEILNALKYVRPGNGFDPEVKGLDIYGKLDVNGEEEAPLYTFLKASCPTTNTTFKRRDHLFYDPIRANDIEWNFEKFLVDRSGRPRYRFLADNWDNGRAVEKYIHELITEH
uniref:Glutathione peroxidase n=1 Tax=Steinernema glaseri TaxID=37863 RepID=A0A1I7Z1W7_9BILA